MSKVKVLKKRTGNIGPLTQTDLQVKEGKPQLSLCLSPKHKTDKNITVNIWLSALIIFIYAVKTMKS